MNGPEENYRVFGVIDDRKRMLLAAIGDAESKHYSTWLQREEALKRPHAQGWAQRVAALNTALEEDWATVVRYHQVYDGEPEPEPAEDPLLAGLPIPPEPEPAESGRPPADAMPQPEMEERR